MPLNNISTSDETPEANVGHRLQYLQKHKNSKFLDIYIAFYALI